MVRCRVTPPSECSKTYNQPKKQPSLAGALLSRRYSLSFSGDLCICAHLSAILQRQIFVFYLLVTYWLALYTGATLELEMFEH